MENSANWKLASPEVQQFDNWRCYWSNWTKTMINSSKDKMLTSYLAVVGQFHLKNCLQKAMKFLSMIWKCKKETISLGWKTLHNPHKTWKENDFTRLEQNGLYQCKYTVS